MPKIYVQLKDLPDFKAGTEWWESSVETADDSRRVYLTIGGIQHHSFPRSTFSEWFKEKKEERWRAKFEKRYYVIKENTINWYIEDNNHTDDRNYSIGNCFQTREEAEQCYQEYILPAFKKYWEDRGMEV